MVKRRGKTLYIYFKPFGQKIGVRVEADSIREAEQIEGAVLRACRTGHYAGLDPISRAVCIRMFQNKAWEMPPELSGFVAPKPETSLTLWKACELFVKYPETRAKSERALTRYHQAMVNVVRLLGKDTPLKDLWVPALKRYQLERQNEGAAPNTINIELSTLSKIFQVMIESQLINTNPVRLVKRLSTKSNEREVYLSRETVAAIAGECPPWYARIIWCAFFSGMRKGEILGLTRKQVNLTKRIVSLSSEDTKESRRKRVPIHYELLPILEEAMRTPFLASDRVFLVQDAKGFRTPGTDSADNCWPRACDKLGLEKPQPWFHDLRHTWKSNARRSGMHPEIEKAIMGHSERGKSVHERYGRISDQELLQAIDRMTFDHGETEIVVSRGNKRETKGPKTKKRQASG